MSRTVDLVVVGFTPAGVDAAIAAARAGRRVLLVDRSRSAALRRRVSRVLAAARPEVRALVSVWTGIEVVCVDGVRGTEAVVLRRHPTGGLVAVNAAEVIAA
ncbi:MAG: FAD-dependent oxidoreductase [Vicinamibacterales bacterium]